jgi:adenylosuccinate synthase
VTAATTRGQLTAAGDHVIVVDLGFGDAGKGTVVDWLCSRDGERRGAALPRTVVRFNGGAQAAHNVVTADGRHHTFAQFGSGMFTPGVRTHLSRFVLVDPLALAAEAADLASAGVAGALGRLTVDRHALLTTPYHRAANRARERARGAARHGSCGMGIGETVSYALGAQADAPRVGDCDAPRRLERKLTLLRDRVRAEFGAAAGPRGEPSLPAVGDVSAACQAFAGRVRLVGSEYLAGLLRAGPVVFEGAQGVLLDEWHGFHPYTTWSTTTFANAETLLADAGVTAGAARLGVVRSYLTRHGPGPLVTEDPTLELPESHNGRNEWQGPVRTGHFDAVALRYAVQVTGGVDGIALTHVDVADTHRLLICHRYLIDGKPLDRLPAGRAGDLPGQERLTRMLFRAKPVCAAPTADWPQEVGTALGAQVTLVSRGPTARDKYLATAPAPAVPP